jgi:WD40 repeat protein
MRVLEGHTGPVRCLAYAPDGQVLASGGDDHAVRLWELSSGRLMASLKGHTDWVRAVAFSRDGKRLASGGWDESVRVWVLAPRRRLHHTQGGYTGGVWSLAFAPGGYSLAFGTGGGEIRLERTGPRERGILITGQGRPVSTVKFSPNGRILATGGHDRTVRLLNGHWGKEQAVLEQPDWVRCLAFSPDGGLLAAGCDNGAIALVDVTRKDVKATLPGHKARVGHVAFAPDGRTLTSAGWDGMVRVWDVASGCERATYDWQIGRVHCLALAPDGMTAAAGGDGTILIWDVE